MEISLGQPMRSHTVKLRPEVKWVSLGIALSASALGAGCSKGEGSKASLPAVDAAASAAVGVKAIEPSTQLSASVMRVTGTVRSKNEATLSAPATGTLTRILVK